MSRPKTSSKPAASRAKTRGAKPRPTNGVPVRDDFHELIEMIAEAKERGVFDRKNNPRVVAKPSVTNTPGAPFARIVAGAKTEDQQLRALEAAALKEVGLPAHAFVVGEAVTAVAIVYGGHPRAGLTLLCARGEQHFSVALADVVFPSGSDGARFVFLYRAWLGLGELANEPHLHGAAPGQRPLALHDRGEWDPAREYWGEEGEPIDEWAMPIIAHGKRPMFEMEQVIPGADPEDFDSDPIVEASERSAAGDRAGARRILMNLLARDLRCLDAHAHLGNFEFDRSPEKALLHYEVGFSIGVFSLGRRFQGVLAWGLIDNRPFLRCMHGVGLCWWRLGHVREAAAVFRKMLWLNPGDNQGVRFNLAAIEAGKTWEEMEEPDA